MTYRFWLCWVVILLLGACTSGKSGDDAVPAVGHTGVARQALTVVDTTPGNDSLAPFGYGAATPTYGQTVTVPASDPVLQGFTVNTVSVPSTTAFRAEVFAWDGAKASGSALFESGSVAPTAATPQTFSFDTGTGGLALIAGAPYVLFVTTSKDAGTGSGAVASRDDDPYAGGTYVFTNSGPTAWMTAPWSDVGAGTDLAFSATFVPLGATATTTTLVDTPPSTSDFGEAVTLTATVDAGGAVPTGLVFFGEGTALLGSAPLNAAGQASLTLSSLVVGNHRLIAAYPGSSSDDASTSATLRHSVATADTNTGLGSSSNPSLAGAPLTFTASVQSVRTIAGVVPTGTVTFADGATPLSTVAIDAGGSAAFTTSSFAAGPHAVTATYSGDASFSGSGAALTQTVRLDGTTVAVTSSVNPAAYAAGVTFTATATSNGGSATPTGSVTFADGATILATVPLGPGGSATFTTDSLTAGSHAIDVGYAGDARHSAAGGALTQAVDKGEAVAAVVSAANPSVSGQSVTFTATVSGAGDTPTGTVTFLDGATSLGTGTLNGSGRASLSTAALGAGTQGVTARYAGDSNYDGDTSTAVSQQVGKAGTSTALASSSSPSLFGASVTFTATVKPVAPGAGTVSGNVVFRDGATTLGTATVGANGLASVSSGALAVGAHTLSAVYSGDPSFATSTSANVTQTVNKAGVSAALSSSRTTSTFGTSVTFTAKVTSSAGPLPSGTVTFKDGAVLLGTATLDATGSTTIATAALTGGVHAITAAYGGDAGYTAASATVTQTVTVAATTTTITSSLNPSVFGQSVTLTATITSTAPGPFTGTMTFTDGATPLGNSAVSAAGVATLSTHALAVSTHAIVATYGGDTNFAQGAASMFSQVVDRASASILVTSSSNPSLAGANVLFTATVTAALPGAGTPRGTVTFKDGSTVLGTGTLGIAGVARVSAELASGAHSITVEYGGDTNFAPGTSDVLAQVVSAEAASVVVTATPNPSTYGQSVTFTVRVDGPAGAPTGMVALQDGSSVLITVDLNRSGSASFKTASLGAGVHDVTAAYGGSDVYATAMGTVSQVVAPASTMVTLASSRNPSATRETVSFTATVSSSQTGFTGKVEFLDGTTSLGKQSLSGAAATLRTSTLSAGRHTVSARYEGDANFDESTSDALTQVITGGEADSGAGGAPGSRPDAGAGGAPGGAAAGGHAGASPDAGSGAPVEDDSAATIASGSCGCRISSRRSSDAVALLALAAFAVIARRRRRAG